MSHSGTGALGRRSGPLLSAKARQWMPKTLLYFFSPQRKELKKNSFLTGDLKQITHAFLSELQVGVVLPPASVLSSECSRERPSVDVQFSVSKY